nr:hypothetical protein [Tanacetum cinerariifolium]
MNPFFTMNQNDSDEERLPNAFEVDDETDVYFLQQAYEYHEHYNKKKIVPDLPVTRSVVIEREPKNMAVTDWNNVYANPSRNMQRTWVERCEVQRRKAKELRDGERHISFQQDLMEQILRDVEYEDEYEDEDF